MTSWDDLVAGGRARRGVVLSRHTTYKLGGPCELFVEVDDLDTLRSAGEALRRDPRPVLVLGRGSNLLVADAGFRGVVLRLGASFASWSSIDEEVVEAGAAMSLPRLARALSKEARGGLEWGVGIPGSVGGAVRQNAGCFGREVVDVMVEAEVLSLEDGEVRKRSARDLDLSYRHSALRSTEVVTSARFRTRPVDPRVAAEEMKEVTRWRREHQPGGTLNAGSVFKNPPDIAAGELIDSLGLKGFSVGPVRVSPRHANFIEAEQGASAEAVRDLIEAVRRRVADETGRVLETEIQFVGFEEG